MKSSACWLDLHINAFRSFFLLSTSELSLFLRAFVKPCHLGVCRYFQGHFQVWPVLSFVLKPYVCFLSKCCFFPILTHSVLLLIPSLCFCPCASSTCCGSVCWNVGGKSLGFAGACYELALKKGDSHCNSSTDRAVRERECVARGVDGECGNALILCQEENNIEPGVVYVAMSIMICLEEQVIFSPQKITDVRSRTWFSEAVGFRKWGSSKPC